MKNKAKNQKRLNVRQPSRIRRKDRLTQSRRSFVGSQASPTDLSREKINLVIATVASGILWLASLLAIAGSLQLPT